MPPHCCTPRALVAVAATTPTQSKLRIDALLPVNPCVICTVKDKPRRNKRQQVKFTCRVQESQLLRNQIWEDTEANHLASGSLFDAKSFSHCLHYQGRRGMDCVRGQKNITTCFKICAPKQTKIC